MKILSGLAEGQVLQRLGSRSASVSLSLETSSREPVEVTITGAKGALKGWKKRPVKIARRLLELTGLPAGGPYRLELRQGKERASIRAFYVGDVWIMAGQSNMEGCGLMTGRAKPHPLIRAFSMRREWRLATDPLHLLRESPDPCHHQTGQVTREEGEKMRREAKKGVGAGIFFAREMLCRTGVPQGLIATAHGGTSMHQWRPEAKDDQYQSMLDSVRATGQPVSGMLWYQGESDSEASSFKLYTDRMKKLVAASRRDLRQPNLPWVIVQLSRFYIRQEFTEGWNSIQEQQRLLPGQIKNLETVAAIDLPLDDLIHISATGYPTLGLRLAEAADYLVHGRGKRAPRLQKIVRRGTFPNLEIDVKFDSIEKGLRAIGEPMGFVLTDSHGAVHDVVYKVTLHGNVARLHCSNLPFDLALHYGHGFSPRCNLTDGRGMAIPVFGPTLFNKPAALAPFIKIWKSSGLIETREPLDKISCPDLEAFSASVKDYSSFSFEGFINERPAWEKRFGHQYFSATLHLSEPMKLCFLVGYDGPFRLWIDGQPFFEDLKGISPCVFDKAKKSIALPAGPHRVTVAMDINDGNASGFCLRCTREDVTPAQVREKNYILPTYSV